MKWTQKLPNKSGYYWFSYVSRRDRQRKVEIAVVDMGAHCGGWVAFIDDPGLALDDPPDDWWWQGPLEIPEFVEAE